MAARPENSPAFEACAAGYYSGGYSSMDDFLAAAGRHDLTIFAQDGAATLDSGPTARTQAERREAKRGLFHWVLGKVGGRPIDYFEFGVMSCRTFSRTIEWTPNRDARFYGFDTFEGLPEPWIRQLPDGSLKMGRDAGELKAVRPPAVYDSRATLFKGLFQETLPDALAVAFPAGRQAERPLFVNIDCDLYSAALFCLTSMHPLLRSGDYVYLDEFFDALNEFAAFNDYIRAYEAKRWFVPVARAYDGMLFRIELPPQPAIEIVDRRTASFLERMQAYLRARITVRKSRAAGVERKGTGGVGNGLPGQARQ